MPKLLHLVVACAENRVIGRERKLPWRIPEDAEHFRQLTAGNICVLGRICFDTWPEATREGRQPIVLTSRPLPSVAPQSADAHAPRPARSLDEALNAAEHLPGNIFVCGGQRIFEETLALPRPMHLHLTLVHAEPPGDRFFPEWRHLNWRELERRESGDANYRYTFFTLERLLD
jgi:dihydrofolate reductase